LCFVFARPPTKVFVNLNDTAKLFDIFNEGGSDLVAHKPCGFVGTKTHEFCYNIINRKHAPTIYAHERLSSNGGTLVPLTEVRVNATLQSPLHISNEKVKSFADLMQKGCEFDPIDIQRQDGCYEVRQGHHRFMASQECSFHPYSSRDHANAFDTYAVGPVASFIRRRTAATGDCPTKPGPELKGAPSTQIQKRRHLPQVSRESNKCPSGL
jgi:hypothetical protein